MTKEGLRSEPIKSMIASPAYGIKVLTTFAAMRDHISSEAGRPLSLMPTVYVHDSEGKPLPGKRVVAFSWPEPIFEPKIATNALIDAIKYAYFENAISPPTDNNGITSFERLTVQKVCNKH